MRDEYDARINRVVDFIETHLEERLTLNGLARLAHFSPFHFHRIFGAMTGETVNEFIRRLRVERAANLLCQNPRLSITQIALECGFGSSAAFAKRFRAHFGMSASEWRDRGGKNGQTVRKNGQTVRNTGEAFEISSPYVEGAEPNLKWRISMKTGGKLEAQVEVRDLPVTHVAYVRHTGPYKGDAQLFEGLFGQLFQWAGPRGLCREGMQILTVYHDNPDVTDEDKLRISVSLSVDEDTPVDGSIGKMALPGGAYAVARFELGPDQYEEAWTSVYGGWLPQSGYQPDDRPALELYHSDPKQHPEGKCVVDICVPVKPL